MSARQRARTPKGGQREGRIEALLREHKRELHERSKALAERRRATSHTKTEAGDGD